ncbi:hypothetical protein F2Q69_00006342 [Brassica cretica]|uniref:Uncharacterized protein n=1 Tax=Brassica cretica TaxID=69181 RepID=A0A8S9P0M0_BRACR|nr:hypothetical protein F2Q69_00006342 [Brassica cretica]
MFSSAKGRAGSNTDSARPFAELDQSKSANGRAGSTEVCLHLILITPLPRLYRTHPCFVSIGGIVRTLQFKNRKVLIFPKNIRIDLIKRQQLAENSRLSTLYEEFECSSEST